jgi:hypothetical protein
LRRQFGHMVFFRVVSVASCPFLSHVSSQDTLCPSLRSSADIF